MATDSNPNEVSVDDVAYPVYANVAAADKFMKTTMHLKWREADDEAKCVALIGATRNLDALDWLPAYATFDDRKAVTGITHGAMEWAGLILENINNLHPASNPRPVRDVNAGDAGARFTDHQPSRASPGVSDDALIAARLGTPTSVFLFLKRFLSYTSGVDLSSGAGTPAAVFGRRSCVTIPATLNDAVSEY